MKIEINTGFKDTTSERVDPFAQIKIDITSQELNYLKNEDQDLYFFLTKVVKTGLVEVDKGVKIF